ncbi:hypothetical protein QTP70_030716 [Hemibagrus guttatus]|uniref:Uncharacterized protein n=1 Tax=Hemibagrus guttatus TaxID=175788 RepID=A0AAE0V0B8_9TELE|nr:hypothetical protein QTP70_030716 [Hemibagrus guttatus]
MGSFVNLIRSNASVTVKPSSVNATSSSINITSSSINITSSSINITSFSINITSESISASSTPVPAPPTSVTGFPTSADVTTLIANSTTAYPGFLPSLLDKIPLPRWAIYAIIALILLVLLICVLCCCIKCCCKGKKKKKKQNQISLKGLNGTSTTALVQPETADVEYGSLNQPRGKLLYSLEYNAARSEMTVGVKEAAELMAMDSSGTSDPYVKVYIHPNKSKTFETKVFRKTLSPVFNEQFKYQISQKDLSESTLVIQVYDFNRFSKHDVIGELRLELSAVDWNHVIEEWRDLNAPSKHEQEHLGEICFSLRYVPTASKLTVVILEAKNLKQMDTGGSSDPYVKIQLVLNKKKWKKKKTSVKKQTLNPYFNESFTFDVSFDQIQIEREKAHICSAAFIYMHCIVIIIIQLIAFLSTTHRRQKMETVKKWNKDFIALNQLDTNIHSKQNGMITKNLLNTLKICSHLQLQPISHSACAIGSCPDLMMSRNEQRELRPSPVALTPQLPPRNHRPLCLSVSSDSNGRFKALETQEWKNNLKAQMEQAHSAGAASSTGSLERASLFCASGSTTASSSGLSSPVELLGKSKSSSRFSLFSPPWNSSSESDSNPPSRSGSKKLRRRAGPGGVKTSPETPEPKLSGPEHFHYSEPVISKVTDYIYIGNVNAAYSGRMLCRNNIDSIIDMSSLPGETCLNLIPCTCSRGTKHSWSRLKVHMEERGELGEDGAELHQRCFDAINECIDASAGKRKRVLVHCRDGFSLAPTCVIQYLMIKHNMRLIAAYELLRAKHPVNIRECHQNALVSLERTLRPGGNTDPECFKQAISRKLAWT